MKSLNLIVTTISIIVLAGCSSSRITQTVPGGALDIDDSGYALQKGDLSNAANLAMQPNQAARETLLQMLQRVPGISTTNGRVRVNGVHSFMTSTAPAYVVNGNFIGQDYRTVMALVDPTKIVKITLLRDADAAIYGSRGGNGVISIRTNNY
ncbi:MAG: TonB-dependent receptor plug domain-containing protein [Cyclobacteriaceae bacterium]